MVKNLKHGIKISKRDVVLESVYYLLFRDMFHSIYTSKLDALNYIFIAVSNGVDINSFKLIKFQSIKI